MPAACSRTERAARTFLAGDLRRRMTQTLLRLAALTGDRSGS